VTGTDLYPTVANITGSASHDDVDGVDLLPLLKDGHHRSTSQRTLYWHFPFYHPMFVDMRPQSAIREGRYKLIYFYEDKRTELYDMEADIGEEHDLSGRMGSKTNQLKQKLLSRLKSVEARLPEDKTDIDK
jgi:arylsulfatase A-like enzyme